MTKFVMLALLVGASACTARRPLPAPRAEAAVAPRSIDEGEAIALIEQLLREAKLRPVPRWQVPLPSRGEIEVDLRLGDSSFGVEWVSAEDRRRYGDALPSPDPGGQLRLLTSPGASQPALILVLDHETYRVDTRRAELRAANAESERQRELEQRLRRDLTDFIEYARSQYRL